MKFPLKNDERISRLFSLQVKRVHHLTATKSNRYLDEFEAIWHIMVSTYVSFPSHKK